MCSLTLPSTLDMQSVGCEVQKDFPTKHSARAVCNELTFLPEDQTCLEAWEHLQLGLAAVKDRRELSSCRVPIPASWARHIAAHQQASKSRVSAPRKIRLTAVAKITQAIKTEGKGMAKEGSPDGPSPHRQLPCQAPFFALQSPDAEGESQH